VGLLRVAFVLSIAAIGCVRPAPVAPPGVAPVTAPHVTQGELDARSLLGDLPTRAMRLGAGPIAMVASGELAMPEERLGAFVEVPVDACLLAYARGAASVEDLDVSVYSEEGTPVALDEASDVHPTVLLCPPHPDRVYVSARAPAGDGLVALAAQLVPRDHAALVARALGARGAVGEGPRPADSVTGLDDVVRTHQTELGGTWELFRKTLVSADTRAPTSWRSRSRPTSAPTR
jgi:hypothetical protein